MDNMDKPEISLHVVKYHVNYDVANNNTYYIISSNILTISISDMQRLLDYVSINRSLYISDVHKTASILNIGTKNKKSLKMCIALDHNNKPIIDFYDIESFKFQRKYYIDDIRKNYDISGCEIS